MLCKTAIIGLFLLAFVVKVAPAQAPPIPIHYDLSFEIDYTTEILQASARIVLRNSSKEPLRHASLLLYRLFNVQEACDSIGNKLEYSQGVTAFGDRGKQQINHVLVKFAQPLAPGSETAIRLRYAGYLLGYSEMGWLYVKDRISPEFTILRNDTYCYPRPGYPASAVNNREYEKHPFTYTSRITVPKGLVVASGGRREGIDLHGDKVTFRYSSLKATRQMYFVIAKYAEIASGNIHIYHFSGDEAGATQVAESSEKAFNLFRQWFGPLAGEPAILTFIEIPDGFGSFTDVPTIIQTAAAFKDSQRLPEVYHEISHLWHVPPTDIPSPRWDEGLATFLQFWVSQEIAGTNFLDSPMNGILGWLRKELPAHEAWKRVPLTGYGSNDLTDLSYSMGAIFFDLLYQMIGKDAFKISVGEFYARFNTNGGSTDDFVKILRKNAGSDISHLINDWIYTTAWADRIMNISDIKELAEYYRMPKK